MAIFPAWISETQVLPPRQRVDSRLVTFWEGALSLWQGAADRNYFGEGDVGMYQRSADLSVCPRPHSYSVELRL